MSKQKKIFLMVSTVFVLAVIGFTVHIFSVTTLPGKKGSCANASKRGWKVTLPKRIVHSRRPSRKI